MRDFLDWVRCESDDEGATRSWLQANTVIAYHANVLEPKRLTHSFLRTSV